ncbi:helix-turn-helix domain-containing protein, partial [Streptomyces sp. CC77]|uniref:helix-turn-helix domain-containing protein n=1 Tax=Streptomyces sp. CC77 TaxID=1906739 RepID=UPI0020C9114F
MDTQQLSAVPPAEDPLHPTAPRSGVLHVTARHTHHFTVVGNHLAQHRRLSLLAIGLALHIQSLPDGARISIRFLAARFPESEERIAAGLRELEAAGYLTRERRRLPNGKLVTRTVFYNQPKGCGGGHLKATAGTAAPGPARGAGAGAGGGGG